MSAPERLVAALADRYRLDRQLGQGGMATVYLAHDLRHGRDVAIKVLLPDLAAALGSDRFLSEIKTTARLQHPHILPLLDSGAADGFLFYVMPYVSGETLRARLERERQLPLEDALRIAAEVADALGAAHAMGIVHRDIKPENILLQGGHALVADFGIALAVQEAGGQRMTQTGLSLGTPQYMSPEQAMGERAIDHRTDIYALGAVTYEMLVGEPPFTGPTVQAVITRALSEEPRAIAVQRKAVPPQVERAVLRALQKLPADRMGTAAEFVQALRMDTGAARQFAPTAPAPRSSAAMRALAVTTVVAVAVAAWALLSRPGDVGLTLQSFDAAFADSAPMRPRTVLAATGFGGSSVNFSLAPDGSFSVYTVQTGDSTSLWYRSLVDATSRRIPGTTGGYNPRISPDGTRLLFVSGGRLLLMPVGGGEPRRLAEAEILTVEWASPTRIYAIMADGNRMIWLDPDGGVVEDLSLEQNARCPLGWWVESERKMLCSFNETARLMDPVTEETWPIRQRGPNGEPGAVLTGAAFRLVGDEHIIFVTLDGELRAATFDRKSRLAGRSVALATGVFRDALGATQVVLSPSGVLGFAPAGGQVASELVIRRADGSVTPLPVERAAFLRFDLSRDRRRLAAVVGTPDGQELRVYDLRTGQRLVWQRAPRIGFPAWNPSGTRIAVRVFGGNGSALLVGAPGAATSPDTVHEVAQTHLDVVEFLDDEHLLVRDPDGATVARLDLGARPVRPDTLPQRYTFASVSPDGRRITLQALESTALFVSDYPAGTTRSQHASGGVEPLWLSNTQLLYRSSARWYLSRVDARTGEPTGPPTLWGEDQAFVDTPGWSNRLSHDGGIIYARRTEADEVRYLRLLPDFVNRMKAAVAAAER